MPKSALKGLFYRRINLLLVALLSIAIFFVSIVAINVVRSLNNKANITKAETNTTGTSNIAISITNEDNTNGNINLNIKPTNTQNTVTGKHTLTTTSNNVAGYNISLQTTTNNNNLVNSDNPNAIIKPIDSTKEQPKPLENKTWGYAIATDNTQTPTAFSPVQPKATNGTDESNTTNTDESDTNTNTNTESTIISSNEPTPASGVSTTIYYGVSLFDVDITQYAGTYRTTVEYAAIANPVPQPTIESISPETYKLGDTTTNANQITITGTNLQSTYSIYLDLNNNNQPDNNEYCTNIQTINNNTQITCNIPTDNIEPGKYNLHITTQGGEVTKEGAVEYKFNDDLQCTTNESNKNITVDIDANMIPIRYKLTPNNENNTWIKADKENTNNDWYNYDCKKWANAITVKDPQKYKDLPVGTPIDNEDIKGFWVYIPRYDYLVKRFNATDPVVQPENFEIRLKTNKDQKHIPTGNNTWATHPAFTWGDTELNGFWMAKFELTGPRTAPTVLPNKVSNSYEYIGSFYNIIKSIGVEDPENTSGGCTGTNYCLSTVTQYNQHNLNKSSSHMLKNSEWGAAAYLSASKYGAGVNNVQINAAQPNGNDDDGSYTYGITGCGPQANGNESSYRASITNGACGNTDRQYTGTLGQLASTTNNVYGVYDMSGGLWEYVIGKYNNLQGSSSNMTTMPTGKYINIYPNNPFEDYGYWINFNYCTWQYCGGHALHETLTVQEVSSYGQSWGGDSSDFVCSGGPWAIRGGGSDRGPYAGVFSSSYGGGYASNNFGARAVLVVNSTR